MKDELEKHSTPTPAARQDHVEDDDEGIGPSPIVALLDGSERHRRKEAELIKAAPKSDRTVTTGQTAQTRQPHPHKHGAPVLQNGVRPPESKPKRPKPYYEGPKPERPKPPISEKPESSHPKPLEEDVSAPQSTSPREKSREESDEETPSELYKYYISCNGVHGHTTHE